LPGLINTAFARDTIADEMIRGAFGMVLDKGEGGAVFARIQLRCGRISSFGPVGQIVKAYKPAALG
jgi:hypothetical protein